MRFLREYRSTARKVHFCDRCCSDIYPGQAYEGFVYGTDHLILVMKEHRNPTCDWPPEPDDDRDLDREDSDLAAELLAAA